METTEKIVESYCRYVKKLFTVSNVKIKNNEVDILAVDTSSKTKVLRYHIEISVSNSSSFSKLTADKFDLKKYKERSNQASQRRSINYFIEKNLIKKNMFQNLKTLGFTTVVIKM